VNFGLECCKHVCQRCIGRRPYSQPSAQGVPKTGFAQIKFNPISIAKHRIVARVEAESPHLRETNFAALSFFTASVTSDLVDDAHWFDGLDLHLDLRCWVTAFILSHPGHKDNSQSSCSRMKFTQISPSIYCAKVAEGIASGAATHWHINRADVCAQQATHSAKTRE
jgi:hypothetical protein